MPVKKPDKKLYKLFTYSLRHNVLPLTSVCSAGCIFCSSRTNPPGLDLVSPGHIPCDFVKNFISLLDHDLPVTIGESATRITEGEPLDYPWIKEVITHIRAHGYNNVISITTNGLSLTVDSIRFLSNFKPIFLTISINSVSHHKQLTGRDFSLPLEQILESLHQNGIPVCASLLYTDCLDQFIPNDINWLIEHGITHIRVLKPGFSRFSDFSSNWPGPDFNSSLDQFRTRAVVTLEPPELSDLKAIVSGIIPGSPAHCAGLLPGDQIQGIDEHQIVCREQAFYLLLESCDPKITYSRGEHFHQTTLIKNKGQKPGTVFDYDISSQDLKAVTGILESGNSLVTASLPATFMRTVFQSNRIFSVPSSVFGGNISVAGLLTFKDIRKSCLSPGKYYIPPVMLSPEGCDLEGLRPDCVFYDHDTGLDYIEL